MSVSHHTNLPLHSEIDSDLKRFVLHTYCKHINCCTSLISLFRMQVIKIYEKKKMRSILLVWIHTWSKSRKVSKTYQHSIRSGDCQRIYITLWIRCWGHYLEDKECQPLVRLYALSNYKLKSLFKEDPGIISSVLRDNGYPLHW